MLAPTPTPELDPASPESPFRDPARAADLRRQLRALTLALFSWTVADSANPDRSTVTERLMAAAIRPWLPKLRDSLLSRLDSVDPAALEAYIGASASALESMLFYAPGDPLPRYVWTFDNTGSIGIAPVGDDHEQG